MVAAVTALTGPAQQSPGKGECAALDHVLPELIFQCDEKLEDLRRLGVRQIHVADALAYYGLNSPDDLRRFTQKVSAAGILSADRRHVLIDDLTPIEAAIDEAAYEAGHTTNRP